MYICIYKYIYKVILGKKTPWFPVMNQQFNTNIVPLEKKSVDGNEVTKLQGDFDRNLISKQSDGDQYEL